MCVIAIGAIGFTFFSFLIMRQIRPAFKSYLKEQKGQKKLKIFVSLFKFCRYKSIDQEYRLTLRRIQLR